MTDVESFLRSLVKGKYSSIILTWNDEHAPMYKEADGYYEYDSSCWVSQGEYLKAMMENSVWKLQFYPDTPIGFCVLYASSIQALIDHLQRNYNGSM